MDLFASGLDIRLLMLAHRGGSVIVKNKALDIKKLTDFKGHTILIPAELSVQNMLLHRLLSSAGLKFGAHDDRTADVTGEVAAPCLMAEMVMADADHDIAGFAVAEPFGSEAVQKKIAASYCTTASLWKNHPCCVFALKSSVITQSFNAVNELVAGFVRAGQLLENKTPDSTLAMVQTFLEVNSDMVRQVLTGSDICFAPQLLIPDRRVLSLIQDYMADTMGIIKSKAPLDTLIDSSFITRALSEINP
jgi:NitT/TauT family transport system substrate-binding protein